MMQTVQHGRATTLPTDGSGPGEGRLNGQAPAGDLTGLGRPSFDTQFDTLLGKSRWTLADESATVDVGFEHENDVGRPKRIARTSNGIQAVLAHSGGPVANSSLLGKVSWFDTFATTSVIA